MKKLIWWLMIPIVVFGIGHSLWKSQLTAPDPKNTKTQAFVIAKGEGTSSVIRRLKKAGLIKSEFAFGLVLRNADKAGSVQAGTFKLSPSMLTPEIVEKLTSGGVVDKWVTLLEGWRIEEMAEKLNQELGIKNEEFLKVAKEGYMFPDTYLFNLEAKAADIVDTMRKNFATKYDQELQNKIKSLGLTSEQGVILASMVEREARSDEARRMVASILLKRLKIGMGLNADATVQYILGYQGEEKSWWKRHLTKEDLKVDSPYNTYLYRGLPPTPIANPGLSSFKAVAGADPSTPYLYYYHDSQGRAHYAVTLEEHNQNVANNL